MARREDIEIGEREDGSFAFPGDVVAYLPCSRLARYVRQLTSALLCRRQREAYAHVVFDPVLIPPLDRINLRAVNLH